MIRYCRRVRMAMRMRTRRGTRITNRLSRSLWIVGRRIKQRIALRCSASLHVFALRCVASRSVGGGGEGVYVDEGCVASERLLIRAGEGGKQEKGKERENTNKTDK